MAQGRFNIIARIRSFKHAFRGIAVMFKTQHNAWIHLLAIAVVVGLEYYLELNIQEWMYISLSIGLVLVAELANTAIEFLGDAVSQEENEQIKNAKDVAAGAVLLAAIVATVVAAVIFIPKLNLLFGS